MWVCVFQRTEKFSKDLQFWSFTPAAALVSPFLNPATWEEYPSPAHLPSSLILSSPSYFLQPFPICIPSHHGSALRHIANMHIISRLNLRSATADAANLLVEGADGWVMGPSWQLYQVDTVMKSATRPASELFVPQVDQCSVTTGSTSLCRRDVVRWMFRHLKIKAILYCNQLFLCSIETKL